MPMSASLKLMALTDGVLSPLSSLIRTLSWMLHASSELLGREGIGIVNGKEGKGLKKAVGC